MIVATSSASAGKNTSRGSGTMMDKRERSCANYHGGNERRHVESLGA